MIQLLSFEYKALSTIFVSVSLFLAILGISQGEIGLGIFMLISALFFGMPFYIRVNEHTIENVSAIGPLFGDPHEAAG